MSRDYAEKEREFIESLKADTGRDLDGWMQAISKQKFAHRNNVIDWLRQQGFLFSWASWLERIHHNGGQPIYYDENSPPQPAAPPSPKKPASKPAATVPDEPPPAVAKPAPDAPESPASSDVSGPTPIPLEGGSVIKFPGNRQAQNQPPHAPRSSFVTPAPKASIPPEVNAVITAAKAYAPLAGFLIRHIADALPGTEFRTGSKHVEMRAGPLPFALLAVGGKELKLAYAGPVDSYEPPCERARIPNLGAQLSPLLTHMISLTDARQIDEAFIEILRQARGRVEK